MLDGAGARDVLDQLTLFHPNVGSWLLERSSKKTKTPAFPNPWLHG